MENATAIRQTWPSLFGKGKGMEMENGKSEAAKSEPTTNRLSP